MNMICMDAPEWYLYPDTTPITGSVRKGFPANKYVDLKHKAYCPLFYTYL